jgi:integrase
LKTSNEQTAVGLGRTLLFQFEQRTEQGLPAKSKLFSAVIDDYIGYRERDHRHGGTSAGMLRQIVRVSKGVAVQCTGVSREPQEHPANRCVAADHRGA